MTPVHYFLVCVAAGSFFAAGIQAQSLPAVPPPPAMPDSAGVPVAPEAVPAGSGEEVGSAPEAGLRDPFWPVGYAPKAVRKPVSVRRGGESAPLPETAVQAPPRGPQWDEAKRKLDIRGISLIGRDKSTGRPKYLAMVAGRLVEEGDTVSVTHDEQTYRWKVVGIGTGGVTFQKLDVRKE